MMGKYRAMEERGQMQYRYPSNWTDKDATAREFMHTQRHVPTFYALYKAMQPTFRTGSKLAMLAAAGIW